jgi:hypothetical protein
MDDASPVMTPSSSFRARVASRRERFNVAAWRANARPADGCGGTLRAGVESLRSNVVPGSIQSGISC